jgi:hypothetical protein
MSYRLMGWFNIDDRTFWSNDTDTNENVERLEAKLEALRGRVRELDLWTTIVEIRQINGQDLLLLFANQNHPRDTPAVVDTLLAYVSEQFPGTFGLLHEYNDEIGEEWWNQYRLRVMVRGQLIDRPDPFFSPIQPTIEDGTGPT